MSHENYDLSFPEQPVVDLYLPAWANLPAFRSKPAFIWVDDHHSSSTVLTYAQLNHSVHSISSHLLLPLQRGDTVVILCPPGLDLVHVIFGCQRAGLLSVPIFPPQPSFSNHNNFHHLLRVLSQTKPKAAIAHPDYIKHVTRFISSASSQNPLADMLAKLLWISTDDIMDKTTNNILLNSGSYAGCGPEEAYLIQYTSGATGIPKPVIVTVGAAAHNVRTARRCYDLHPNSVIVSWLPQYHDCGLMFLLLTIVSGATCILASPATFISRPRLWLEMMSEFKATCTPVPSFTLPLVVRRGGAENGSVPINLQSLKNLIIINEPLYKEPVEEFVNVFVNYGLDPSSISPSYGLAENCTFVSTAWRSNQDRKDSNFPSHNRLLPSARLGSDQETEDIDILVVNEDTHEAVEDGVEGEIWVGSASNASGYLSHPSLTREVFRSRLSNKVSRRFVRTGDRGIVKGEQRFLFVTGRCADVIKLQNGKEIHSHYIETTAYNSCPKLLRGGCLAAFEASRTVVVVAEMQSGEKDEKVLRSVCERIRSSVLEEEKVEVGLVVLVKSGSVPKTTSGKIQRWAAKDKVVGGKMRVVMEMEFGENYGFMALIGNRVEEKNRVGGEGTRELFVSHATAPTRPSLLSLL